MRKNRFYENLQFSQNDEVNLNKEVSGHIHRVLRLKEGDIIELFNGDGYNYKAEITETGKKVAVVIKSKTLADNESPLNIHLGQCISKGERMDFTLQKAVEIGVTSITPLISARVQFRFDEKRQIKKLQHWQKVICSACEQSGRATVPTLFPVVDLKNWLNNEETPGIVLDPLASMPLISAELPMNLRLLVGPEGGLTENELEDAKHQQFQGVTLGPRILRTETAALSALSILQAKQGDFR